MKNKEVQQFYRPYELPPTNPEDLDRYIRDFEVKREEMIKIAAEERDHAVSYRPVPFKVGSTVLSKEPNQAPGEYSIHAGHNYTPTKAVRDGVAKRCGEKQALEKALARQTKQIIAIVSVSDQISTGDDTKAHDALHPCPECRKMIRQMVKEGLISEQGIICNVNDTRTGPDGQWAREERTVGELLDMYEDLDNPKESVAA